MPELNPRLTPTRFERFLQVAAAVLAGMAALYCVQNLVEAGRARPATAAPAPAAARAPEAPNDAGPSLSAPERTPAPRRAESHMLVKGDEEAAPPAAIEGVYGEQPPPKVFEPPAPRAAHKAPKQWRKGLSDRTMSSPYAADIPGARRSSFMPLKVRPRPDQATEPEETAPAPVPAKAPGFTALASVPKTGAPPENMAPSPVHPEEPPQRPFWPAERRIRVLSAGLLAVLLLGYVLAVGGIFSVRERREGEL